MVHNPETFAESLSREHQTIAAIPNESRSDGLCSRVHVKGKDDTIISKFWWCYVDFVIF